MDPRFLKGAAAEYVAASWYLRQGYEVWWPSVQQSRVDFYAVKGKRRLKVQVKTARWDRRPEHPVLVVDFANTIPGGRKRYTTSEIDVLVAVDEQRLWVFPFKKIAHRHNAILDRTNGKPARRDMKFNASPFRVQ